METMTGVILSFIMSGLALFVSLKKTQHENIASDGAAAKSYADAAQTYADEVHQLRMEMSDLREEIKVKDKVIEEQRVTIEILQDWSERLVYQVKAFGQQPVMMRKRAQAAEG